MLLPRVTEPSPLAGVLRPWPAVLVTWGPGGASRPHAHHCWHLLLGLDADLGAVAGGHTVRRVGALLTAPDVVHAVDASGTRVLVVFVDPESEAGEHLLAARGRGGVEFIRGGEATRLRALLAPGGAVGAYGPAAVGQALGLDGEPLKPPAGRHPAIRRVLRYLREAPPGADASLAGLAARARLSPGRFLHAFTATVGIPLRPYVRWQKLERAAAGIAAGVPFGAAAYAAGFADAAHMTRTFRAMFGVTPSELRRRSQSVQDG